MNMEEINITNSFTYALSSKSINTCSTLSTTTKEYEFLIVLLIQSASVNSNFLLFTIMRFQPGGV